MNFQKKIIKSFFLLFLFLLISSCQTFEDVGKVMRNEKVNTTDEFLVEKNQPLIIPPNLNELPAPSEQKQSVEKANSKKKKRNQIAE